MISVTPGRRVASLSGLPVSLSAGPRPAVALRAVRWSRSSSCQVKLSLASFKLAAAASLSRIQLHLKLNYGTAAVFTGKFTVTVP
jgi:hypothetical protein